MYDAPHPRAQLLAQGAVFLENIDKLADEDWAHLPVPDRMLGCIVAGEAVRRRVEEQLELWDLTPHWVVSSAKEAGLVNGYDHPARLGAWLFYTSDAADELRGVDYRGGTDLPTQKQQDK